uniref:Uncharacterized protein n=1 Tax=Ditylenchus dipsaci TaxID=166011 RepID=A0A915D8U4_9BILA
MDQKSTLRRADSFKSPAIFNINIPNFDNFCKSGTEKAFSDLAYIRELPWQIFAAAEHTDPNKVVRKTDAISKFPTPEV